MSEHIGRAVDGNGRATGRRAGAVRPPSAPPDRRSAAAAAAVDRSVAGPGGRGPAAGAFLAAQHTPWLRIDGSDQHLMLRQWPGYGRRG